MDRIKSFIRSVSPFGNKSKDDPTEDSDDSEDKIWELQAIDIRAALMRFYRIHNPEKIRNIDSILENFLGEESVLLQQLCDRYDVSDGEMQNLLDSCPLRQIDSDTENGNSDGSVLDGKGGREGGRLVRRNSALSPMSFSDQRQSEVLTKNSCRSKDSRKSDPSLFLKKSTPGKSQTQSPSRKDTGLGYDNDIPLNHSNHIEHEQYSSSYDTLKFIKVTIRIEIAKSQGLGLDLVPKDTKWSPRDGVPRLQIKSFSPNKHGGPSISEVAGMQLGDLIERVNGRYGTSHDDLKSMLEKRHGKTAVVTVQLLRQKLVPGMRLKSN